MYKTPRYSMPSKPWCKETEPRRPLGRRGWLDFTPRIRYEVKGANLVADLLCSNACVAVLPPYMLLHHFRSSEDSPLRVVRLKEKLPPLYIGMVYPETNRGLLSSPVYGEFIDLLTQQIKSDIRSGETYCNPLPRG